MQNNRLNIPSHVGIILDGNRRWAKERNLPRFEGHRRGFNNLKRAANYAFKKGVKILTVYAFSTENWHRDKTEVSYLLKLFKILVKKELKAMIKKGVRVNFWGRRTDFDKVLQAGIREIEEKTKNGIKGVLNICLSYGGRDEIVRAVKKIVRRQVKAADISEELLSANLDSAGYHDPDLIIRTSGEERLSGFLTWQSVYSELYFSKTYWPDFSSQDFDSALEEYGRRQRRYGEK